MTDDAHLRGVLTSESLMETLAAIEHERWAHWQRYVHRHCQQMDDGSLVIPAHLARQWEAQIATSYPELSEVEKESDREQVRRYLHTVIDALTAANNQDPPIQ